MPKSKRVSSKTHSKQQLDDYANQHNPNNIAYKTNITNKSKQKNKNSEFTSNVLDNLEWYCYGNPFDFD